MTLEERLAECCGEVELLTAVMELVDCPEDCHLVTGSVEPVVATVQSQGRGHPGGGGVPGQVSEAVVLVDVDIEAEQGGLGDQATRCHEEASGYAGHTVSTSAVSQLYLCLIYWDCTADLSAMLCFLPTQMLTRASGENISFLKKLFLFLEPIQPYL